MGPRPSFNNSLAVVALALLACGPAQLSAPPIPENLDAMDAQLASALRAGASAVESAPDDAGSWRDLAMLYQANGLYQLAETCYAEAVARNDEDPETWYGRALLAMNDGRPEDARTHTVRSLELDPNYAPAYYRVGQWLLAEGDFDNASQWYQLATQANANNPGGWIGLARVHLQKSEYTQAAQILQARVLGGVNHAYGCQLLARALNGLGREEEARVLAGQGRGAEASTVDPRWSAILAKRTSRSAELQRATKALSQGRPVEAVSILEAQLRLTPNDGVLLSNLAFALVGSNRLDEAIQRAREAQAAEPDSFRPFLVEAQALDRKGTPEARSEALRLTRAALDRDPNAVPALQYLGVLHSRQGDDTGTLQAYRKASALDPDNLTFLLNVGVLERKLGLWAEALETYGAILDLAPGHTAAKAGSGEALKGLGRLPEAEEQLRSAVADLERAGPQARQDLTKVLGWLVQTLDLQGKTADANEVRARL